MRLLAMVLAFLMFEAAAIAPARHAYAADVDELLRLEDWLHGPPVPLFAYA